MWRKYNIFVKADIYIAELFKPKISHMTLFVMWNYFPLFYFSSRRIGLPSSFKIYSICQSNGLFTYFFRWKIMCSLGGWGIRSLFDMIQILSINWQIDWFYDQNVFFLPKVKVDGMLFSFHQDSLYPSSVLYSFHRQTQS